MKISNKQSLKKIIIVLLIILLFQFVAANPVHAVVEDALLEPITVLFANLGDGIMEIMQKTFLDVETSGAWIEEENNLWIKILIIAAAILAAVVAIIATVYSGGAALTIVGTILGAFVKIGVTATVVYFAVDTLRFGEEGFYLPEYYLTPETIFRNEVLAFDVNFFNPKKEEKVETIPEWVTIDLGELGGNYTEETLSFMFSLFPTDENGYNERVVVGYNDLGHELYGLKIRAYILGQNDYDNFKANYGFEDNPARTTKIEDKYIFMPGTYQDSNVAMPDQVSISQEPEKMYKYEWEHEGIKYEVYYGYLNDDWDFGEDYYLYGLRYYHGAETYVVTDESLAYTLQPTIAAWYVTLRNIALVALLSILVYIGIRITLSSVSSDKAKYKQMLIDWTVAICLVFLMHYIMSFSVTINEYIVKAISSITVSNISEDLVLKSGGKDLEKIYNDTTEAGGTIRDEQIVATGTQAGVQLFVIEDKDAVSRAYDTLVGDNGDDENSGDNSSFKNRFTNGKDGVLYWPANDFMTQARLLGQNVGENEAQEAVIRAGYNIIYVVLVIYTIIFCFTYLKRVIYIAFLTIIAPLVAITYPIDKLNDGQAQAFNLWLKEYIFNLLIQPMHLILYTILVGSAMKFAATNIFYVVVALGFLVPAENLLRRFFGFEKSQTAGSFGGVAGAALMMSGLNNLLKGPKGSSKGALPGGNGKGGDKEDDEGAAPPWRDKEFDPTNSLIDGEKEKEGEFKNNLTGKDKAKFDLAKAGRDEALEGLKGAKTRKDKKDYKALIDSYNKDLDPYRNPNWKSGTGTGEKGKRSSGGSKGRRKSPIRGVRRAGRHYFKGLGNKMIAKHRASGGLVRRGARLAGGLALGTVAAAGAGFAGIATGSPSKAAQYMATAAGAGYSVGRGAVDNLADNISDLKIEGTGEEYKKGYYADEYKEHEQKKYKKEFMKEDENIRKIEDKLKVERAEAERIMRDYMGDYLDKEIYEIDDLVATYKMEKELGMSREQAMATAQYATQVMNGEDTRYMTAKRKDEYKNTFIPKFTEHGSKNAKEDVDRLFTNLDKFYGFKK